MNYLIKVEGEIIAKEKNHIAQGWACKSVGQEPSRNTNFIFDEGTHTIKSDLILDKHIRAVPYAIYYTEKGIKSDSNSNAPITVCPGYGAALLYFKENLAEIQKLLDTNIDSHIEENFYRGLFIDVFSTLELFLSDVILCLIYHKDKVYENAIERFKVKKSKNFQTLNKEIEKEVHNYFFKEIVYHKFDTIDSMFKDLLNVSIPDYTNLSKYLHKRNNIVHRYSLSNIDRMRVTIINKKVVQDLINTTDDFVDKLIINIQSALKIIK